MTEYIIQHINNEAQIYRRKAGDDLDFTIYVYRRISVDYGDEFSVHYDHIWAVLQCVE